MPGPKLNEGATVVGERTGTRASARYVRVSARKARAVLNLVRGLDVRRADEVLQFTDRAVAREIRKVLASAVANAVHNDEQDPDELYISACFADEGPTMRRFRPRARGRATRIRKRSCHITIIVSRMSDERLAVIAARAESGGRPASVSRQARVERSRRRAEAAAAEVDEIEADEAVEDGVGDDATVESTDVDMPAGAMAPLEDGSAPEGHPIKANADSGLYHEPDSRYYDVTVAEFYFESAEAAEAAGFTKPASASDDSQGTDDTDSGDSADEGDD